MNVINLIYKDWKLNVDLEGGRIIKLEKRDQKILGTFDRIDGKQGNTHVCVPNFAAEGMEKYGFIFHGPFRNSEWKLINQTNNSLEINCEIDALNVIQRFSIGNKFKQEIIINNKSTEVKRVNVGMHNYWDTEFGWKGSKLNGKKIDRGIKNSVDLKIEKNNVLELPNKAPINWYLFGFKYVKLWTGVKEEKGEKIFDQKYICVEPIMERERFVEDEASLLKPRGELRLKQVIEVF
ncbi:MAG: hypothetical protein PHO75_02875 [Candidatus Shapirobacteria bacterium]|jgi:hypothetical protein|nr:hypothetical protein [Candidatus Shapirobacteria bacterium]